MEERNMKGCRRGKEGFILFLNPMDYSLSGSSVHGILQARTLEWVAMPSSIRKLE